MARMVRRCACCGNVFVQIGKQSRGRKTYSEQCVAELAAMRERSKKVPPKREKGKFVSAVDEQVPGPNDPTIDGLAEFYRQQAQVRGWGNFNYTGE